MRGANTVPRQLVGGPASLDGTYRDLPSGARLFEYPTGKVGPNGRHVVGWYEQRADGRMHYIGERELEGLDG